MNLAQLSPYCQSFDGANLKGFQSEASISGSAPHVILELCRQYCHFALVTSYPGANVNSVGLFMREMFAVSLHPESHSLGMIAIWSISSTDDQNDTYCQLRNGPCDRADRDETLFEGRDVTEPVLQKETENMSHDAADRTKSL
jgi:hypothetical protein